jgi:hypothetical protein
VIYSECGLSREARVEFEHLATDNFTTIPQDALWGACMVYLAEVCTCLGDAHRAATLYQCLTPIAVGTAVYLKRIPGAS